MLQDLHIGVAVSGRDGRRLGTLVRIVIDRESTSVTHIVVDPGLVESGNLFAPGGWEKPRARVVPEAMILSADADGVRLACDESELHAQPLFESEQYAAVDVPTAQKRQESWWSRFRMGDVLNYVAAGWGLGAPPVQPPTAVTLNEPPGSAAIEEGTPVWRKKPHDEVGTVDRVLFDPETDRISALVIYLKGISGRLVLLPMSAIADVEDDVVHITLSDAEIEKLAPYEPER